MEDFGIAPRQVRATTEYRDKEPSSKAASTKRAPSQEESRAIHHLAQLVQPTSETVAVRYMPMSVGWMCVPVSTQMEGNAFCSSLLLFAVPNLRTQAAEADGLAGRPGGRCAAVCAATGQGVATSWKEQQSAARLLLLLYLVLLLCHPSPTHTHTHTHAHIHTHTRTRTYTHTHTHKHTNTNTHTSTHFRQALNRAPASGARAMLCGHASLVGVTGAWIGRRRV